MARVQLKFDRTDGGCVQLAGDVIEVEDREARVLIERGTARLVEEMTTGPRENAALRTKATKRITR